MTHDNGSKTTSTESSEKAAQTATSGCCGGPATSNASACCALDEQAKANGGIGCGCGAKPAAPKQAVLKPSCC